MGSLGGGEMSKLALGYRYNYGIGTPRNCDEAAFQYMPIANNGFLFLFLFCFCFMFFSFLVFCFFYFCRINAHHFNLILTLNK